MPGTHSACSWEGAAECGAACPNELCQDGAFEGDTEQGALEVTSGQTYYLIVEGWNAMWSGPFTISADYLVEICDDLLDNDQNNAIDCADPACQMDAACMAGMGAVGTACTANTDCAANMNDPLCFDEANLGHPGGYCMEWCDMAMDDCPMGSTCSDFGLSQGLCLENCTVNTDCTRTEYGCWDPTATMQTNCWPDTCQLATAAAIGANMGDTAMAPSAGYAAHNGSCQNAGSPEVVYSFQAPSTGTLDMTLSSMTDMGMSIRGACQDPTSELDCADLEVGGTDETLAVAVTQGEIYTIIVAGFAPGEEGAYTLTLAIN